LKTIKKKRTFLKRIEENGVALEKLLSDVEQNKKIKSKFRKN
jgi:hypothetical protein